MAKITQDFINNLGSLYGEIQTKDTNFLNEESEYYDEELADLSEDIVLSIALSMFSEGHTTETFLKFLSSSDEEIILEKYLSTNATLLSEEVVHTEFVEEQLELLELNLGPILRLFAKGSKSFKGLAGKGVTKAATAGVERRVGRQLARSGNLSRTEKALEKVARGKATKAGITAPDGALSPKQSTQLLKQARTAQAVKGVKSAATGALLTGLGVVGGYTGAKLAGGGPGGGDGAPSGGKPSAEPQKGKDDFLKGSVLAKLGGKEGRLKGGEFRTMAWSPESKARYKAAGGPSGAAPAAPSTPSGGGGGSGGGKPSSTPPTKPKAKPEDKGPEGETPMQKWARLHPDLAKKVKPGQSGYGEISAAREKPAPGEKQDQTPTQGRPEAQIDVKDVEASIKAEQERQRKRAEQKTTQTAATTTTTTAKESYDAYDVILEYLISTEQVETLDEAHYIMMEMDETAVANIMQEYQDYLISEEIKEWVDSLLDEGYDLSEYSWDDVVEHYFSEAKYGTAKGRKKLAKKVRTGEDVGKKGGGFEEIVDKATPKYGKERATKIAAAAMWKNLGK